jgi:ATP/ADP translocase
MIAGFLESVVTRHTELPDFLRLAIILFSLGFVIFYYLIYPRKKMNSRKENELLQIQ